MRLYRAGTMWIAAVALFAGSLRAQTSAAQITGRVIDPAGAAVSNADVTVTNTDTNVARSTKTSDNGYYTVPLLPPGPYKVAVAVAGFRSMTQSNLTLEVDQTARVDFSLVLGEITQSVDVRETAPLLDTENAALGQVVESAQITELPTNGRNTLAFVELTPGVRVQPGSGTNPYVLATNSRGNFSVNGGVSNANEVLVDGAPVTIARSNAIGYIPPVDATQEFRVDTNSYSAEYGRTSGGVVNLSIRSGANQFHGDLYEFLRNNATDANDFFQNAAGLPILPLKQNQYGVAVGGPIRRNKTFFFGNFEGFNLVQGATFTGTVPTALQRQGNFSQTYNSAGQLISIANPFTTTESATGTYSRSTLAGGIIPPSLINPVAAAWLKLFYPMPNEPGNPLTGANNYSTSASHPYTAQQGVGRIDHNFSDSLKLFATYAQQHLNIGNLNLLGNNISPVATDQYDETFTHDAVLAVTKIFSAHLIGEFRSSFIRLQQVRVPPTDPFNLASLGLPANLNSLEAVQTVPLFTVTGYTSPNAIAASVTLSSSNDWAEGGTITWIRGTHTLKFGGQYRLMQLNDVASSGSFASTFTSQFTSSNPLAATATSGSALASFLVGTPSAGSLTEAVPLAEQRWYMDTFVQDDWKIMPKLTLNLGLQYSLDSSVTERFNRLAWFNPATIAPIVQALGLPYAGSLNFAGSSDRTPEQLYKKQFAPRIGLAYQATSKVVVRAGYGLFWLPNNLNFASTSQRSSPWSSTTTLVSSQNGGITPYNTLSNPFPNGVVLPPGPSQGLNTLLGQALSVYLQSNHPGYVQQWNFNVQANIWKGVVANAAYAGSKGTGLPLTLELNQLNPSYLSMGTALTQLVPNPFYGQITTGILANPTVALNQLLRPFPQFGSIQAVGANAGSSSYNALETGVTKRFGSSIIQALYTRSKAIGDSEDQTPAADGAQPGGNLLLNNYYHPGDRSLAEFDSPNRFVVSYTVRLPFGPRQPYLKSGIAGAIAGGWELSGIYTAQTGTPLFLATSTSSTNDFVAYDRPNSNGMNAALSGTAQSRLNEWFNTSDFYAPAAFTIGNISRTLSTVRNDGINNIDAGVFRNFPFREGRFNLQFRAEAFNLANRVQFANPGLTLGTATFGVVSAAANTPRQLQFALKLLF